MNKQSSKSLLPLVEILIAVGIFAVAVGLTLQLFLFAKFLGDKTSDTAIAVFEVQNVAENIKMKKSAAEIENYLSSELNGGVLYFDSRWNIAGNEDSANSAYNLEISKIEPYGSGGLYKFGIKLTKKESYPFIDDKKVEKGEYFPELVFIEVCKFIVN